MKQKIIKIVFLKHDVYKVLIESFSSGCWKWKHLNPRIQFLLSRTRLRRVLEKHLKRVLRFFQLQQSLKTDYLSFMQILLCPFPLKNNYRIQFYDFIQVITIFFNGYLISILTELFL